VMGKGDPDSHRIGRRVFLALGAQVDAGAGHIVLGWLRVGNERVGGPGSGLVLPRSLGPAMSARRPPTHVFEHGIGPRGCCSRSAAPRPRHLASHGPWPGQDGFVDAASTRAVCGICPLASLGEIACFFRHAIGS
jgi:hypothetical protein